MTRRNYSPNAVSAQQKTKELTKKLEQAITALKQTNDYKQFLNLMAHLPHYSFRNLALIAYQKPKATMVMGYRSWQKYHRYVMAGERAITIFAPRKVKIHTDGTNSSSDDADDNQNTDSEFVYFRPVSVFDISQTDGADMPNLKGSTESFKGDFPNYRKTVEKIIKLNPGTDVKFVARRSAANGCFDRSANVIKVCDDMSQTETIRTLIHEETHARLHSHGSEEEDAGRDVKEAEAEGVSYVVCKAIGINTDDYAVPYITGWMHEADDTAMQEAMGFIQKTANEFINKLQVEN